jgi:hypothetical protein
MLYVEEKKVDLQSTTYFIDGGVDEVHTRITKIMRDYNPMAYGTFVYRLESYDNGKRVKAEVRRSNSAD